MDSQPQSSNTVSREENNEVNDLWTTVRRVVAALGRFITFAGQTSVTLARLLVASGRTYIEFGNLLIGVGQIFTTLAELLGSREQPTDPRARGGGAI